MWNSFLQFTHLSQYEDERRASSGQLMVLFYVKGSQPNSHDALLLRTSKITVVRRVSKVRTKAGAKRQHIAYQKTFSSSLRPSLSLIPSIDITNTLLLVASLLILTADEEVL